MCLCVCPRGYLRNHERDLYQFFFVHVAYVRVSLLLWRVDDKPHRLSPGRGFLPIENALYSIAFGTNTDRNAQRGRSTLSTIALFEVVQSSKFDNHIYISLSGSLCNYGKMNKNDVNELLALTIDLHELMRNRLVVPVQQSVRCICVCVSEK